MMAYEQSLKLFQRWCMDEMGIFTVDKVTENVIRRYIMELQERGKYTFYTNDKQKKTNYPERRRDYRQPVSTATINNYIFTFKPSHSTVLCTNHMPAVKAVDNGTWDRLIVVPFNGRFRNQATEIKNYGAYLVENCGGAILKWIIACAQKYIHNDYKLIIPEAIKAVTKEYQAENDWASDFFSKCLSFEPDLSATASELYSAYTTYCQGNHIAPLPQTKVMPRIHEHYGVVKKRTNRGIIYTGVGLSRPESMILLEASAGECIEDSKDTDWDDIWELLELPTQQSSQPS